MNLVADDVRRETAPGVEGSRALSVHSGHLQSKGSDSCELVLIGKSEVPSHVLPSVDLNDLASRAHCRWAAGSWLAREINLKLVPNF